MKIVQPLRERDFALLFGGLTVSLIGDGLYLVAVAWQVYDLSNTPSALALVGLAWSIGLVLFLLTGGVVSDRFDRRRVMIVADLVRGAVLVVIGVLAATGDLQIWHLVGLVVLYAGGEAFFGPALGAIIPDLVSRERVVEANALSQSVRQTCRLFIGPALGGLLVASSGTATAFLVDAGTFIFSAVMIGLIRTPSPGHGIAGTSVFDDLRAGFSYVRSQRWIWVTLIVAALFTLFYWGPIQVLLPYVVRNELGGGAETFGLVLAADGVGSVLASIVLSQRGLPRRYLTTLYGAWALATLPFIGYAIGSAAWQFMLLAAVHGALMTTGLVIWAALEQTRVPRDMRARVGSVDWFASVGFAPVSFALVGPAAAGLGVSATLIVAAVVPSVVTAGMYLVFRIGREQPPISGEPEGDELLAAGPVMILGDLESAPGSGRSG